MLGPGSLLPGIVLSHSASLVIYKCSCMHYICFPSPYALPAYAVKQNASSWWQSATVYVIPYLIPRVPDLTRLTLKQRRVNSDDNNWNSEHNAWTEGSGYNDNTGY